MTHYCEKCGKTLDVKQFYKSNNIEKYPHGGYLNQCKKCITMHVDNWDPETFLWILQEVDVPYIEDKWNKCLETYGKDPAKITGLTILGRYLSGMKIKQFNELRWADTERLAAKAEQEKIINMKAQGYTEEDIAAELEIDRRPEKPTVELRPAGEPSWTDPSAEEDEFSSQLTEEDKLMLRLKWGRDYRPEEWVRMEQLYNDMMASYDIQSAGHKDTLIMLCKTSLKANQLIDAGDIEGFQKMQKAYDSLMKSGKFTAAQNKAEGNEYVDSIGELVAICEKEGFIPRYYVSSPQDKVDETLRDLQQYTHTLVTEEMNLGNMIEASMREIFKDKEREATIDVDDGDAEGDDSIMNYEAPMLTEEDYDEFSELLEDIGEDDE